MPFLSVIVTAVHLNDPRELIDALAAQTFTDFELVLADPAHEERKDLVRRIAWERFVDVRHVGITPAPEPGTRRGLLLNVAIVTAVGDVVLFLGDDQARPAPDLLERHVRFHLSDPTDRGGMVGAVQLPEGRAAGHAAGRMSPGKVRLLNASVSRARLIEVGGIDEEFDAIDGGDPRHLDAELAERLTAGAGVAWLSDPSAVVAGLPDATWKSASRSGDLLAKRRAAGFPPQPTHRLITLKKAERVDHGRDLPDPPRAAPPAECVHEVDEMAGVCDSFPALYKCKKCGGSFQKPEEVEAFKRQNANTRERFMRGLPNTPEESDRAFRERVVERDAARASEFLPIDVSSSGQVERPLRVVMIYGEFSSAIHGPFDLSGLYERVGLTGSESSFFNLATSLSEMGHEVAVFCVCEQPFRHPSGWEGIPIQGLEGLPRTEGLDAVITWNEPDYLRYAPVGVRRYCDQQLNDFGYCREPNWQRLADVWVSPSENHRQNVMANIQTGPGMFARVEVIPNSVPLELFSGPAPARNPRRVVWCSSPDRGLHHLLSMWPDVRARVPDAELRVFYRLRPWLERAIGNPDEVGRRARYIAEVLPRLAHLGVEVLDVVPNRRMAEELRSAACLAYPCDPVRYTEGFGCSVLDAAAAGCVPIISAADALPTVHGSAAIGIAGPPGQMRRAWIEAISSALTHGAPPEAHDKMRAHAETHDRKKIAQAWVRLLKS